MNYPGSDCGAKINAADQALGQRSGTIEVSMACGAAWTTPVRLSQGHLLRMTEGGTYSVSAPITMGSLSSIAGMPKATNSAPVVLQEASGANLPELVHMTGYGATIEDVYLDGNGSQNPGGGYGVFVDSANRVALKGVDVHNARTDNVHVSGAASCCGRIIDGSFLVGAGNDNLYLNGITDWIISTTEFENAGGWGIEGMNAATVRISNSDFGANTAGGIKIAASAGSYAGGWIVVGSQFGNELGTDFFSDGSAGAYTNGSHSITGNQFIGLGSAPSGMYDAIHLHDSGNTAVTGNFFGGGGNRKFRYHYFSDASNGAPEPSTFTGNVVNGGGAASGDYNPLAGDAIASNTGSLDVPTASGGVLTGTSTGGYVSGLSGATTLTIAFPSHRWVNWVACTAVTSATGVTPSVGASSSAAVTFRFQPLTGTLYYHCEGQ